MSAAHEQPTSDIKQVPQDRSIRDSIRSLADELGAEFDHARYPSSDELKSEARSLLNRLSLPEVYLGYAMVALSNVYWRRYFETVPFHRRLLLLPHCMSNQVECTAELDASNLLCRQCDACNIGGLKSEAEKLGYEVIVSEGTTAVIMKVLEGGTDALLGVACLDSLEKSFTRISEIGIPYMAVPLLQDGCVNTTTELDELRTILRMSSSHAVAPPRSYVHLLRESMAIFDNAGLTEALPSPISGYLPDGSEIEPHNATEKIALDWFAHGGKRLRPFLTVASYAVATQGSRALEGDLEIPVAIRRLAMAIEAMHKASLVHDDIEDDDVYRYGQMTIHRKYGVAPAINVGDYLVGLGYNLVAGEVSALGAECVADILRSLSSAHLDLCRGQGAELMWKGRSGKTLSPMDVLSIYSLKTAPGLEVALYAGLRAAMFEFDHQKLRLFCTYLGEGYQALNDLDDWKPDNTNRKVAGGDVLAQRPTILHAFALQACPESEKHLLHAATDSTSEVVRLRRLYTDLGVFDKTQLLVQKLRSRAEELASQFEPLPMQELMRFIIGLVLPGRIS